MKFLIFLLFSSISTQCVFSQDPACTFDYNEYGYLCYLNINNPNGFDNFTPITGDHMQGRSDSDVILILPGSPHQSTIFPSIVCQQFVNIRTIELIAFGLQRIGDEAFRSCKNLIELVIHANPLTEISENALVENRNLQDFFTTASSLVTLPKNVFANQQSLLRLILSGIHLESLPDGIFDSLSSLQLLIINNNRVSTFPDGIFKKLTNVRIISLSNSQLTTLNPVWFENLQNLDSLQIDYNQITTLPPNMFNSLKNFRSLTVSDNNLTTLHSNSFVNLPRLRDITMMRNQLNSIDERIIDNTGINNIFTGGNPCDTTSGIIFDQSPNRDEIRAAWQQCFDNFEDNQCEVGNLDERVCRLEEEAREMRELIRELTNK